MWSREHRGAEKQKSQAAQKSFDEQYTRLKSLKEAAKKGPLTEAEELDLKETVKEYIKNKMKEQGL